ncbi:MAG TPA: NAD-dependent epimerase/dehydratase family protein, partial [Ktedonobacterales bacterium]|nr:NAD-dependent epimerase/dehydratase family protein [Ktedonobacterales bacterium]
SHLSERLLSDGYEVVGIDCFTDYYAREIKESNVARLREEPRFTLLEMDLSSAPVEGLLEGIDEVYHLAAQAGVRGSFGDSFELYVRNNVQATQRLLEQAARTPVEAFVYASSSSVYGNAAVSPTPEDAPRQPISPYGMTKVATEEIAAVYHRNHGVPAVGLRYFTAYGPRQRPDMAFNRFIRSALAGKPIAILGDGMQVRDFTYVDDVVEGTRAASARGKAGSVYNIGGAEEVSANQVIALLQDIIGKEAIVQHGPARLGEQSRALADMRLAREQLGFVPATSLRQGLEAQVAWQRALARD